MKQFSILVALFVISFATAPAFAQKAKSFYTSGYFNGITMTSKESGDYGGISVYLTQTENDTYALVTEAAGPIFNPKLVPVKISGKDMRTIESTLPSDDGDRKFRGTVTATNLRLSSGDEQWTLKRQCASTYSNIAASKESGDLGGTEIHVTDSGGTWWVLYSIAEGAMSAPKLVEAKVTGRNFDKFEFAVPGDAARKFTGVRGVTSFTLNDAGTKSVLKQKCYQ